MPHLAAEPRHMVCQGFASVELTPLPYSATLGSKKKTKMENYTAISPASKFSKHTHF